ncbi:MULTISPECIES: DUF1642 domain-containing protein [unclassified Streptococcus]|uniref:DUF1642 domain-containing protein n=1 Tax=unclassified Streptococcus TaxID=2608887 RepID=UPI0015630359|nr:MULTISPECIES: DUF1642 domain-containing protein [unclassified Streptococcus]
MNIKSLIKKYEAVECVVGIVSGKTILKTVLRDLKQLDEPKPVKVPEFVADFIEKQKKLGHTLSYSIDASMSDIVAEWYWDNSELFALAWIFGYEVEKEKRYTVVTKATKQPLYYNAMDKKLFFSMGGLATNFTRKQLEEAGFGWVFDCPGVEVKEVE